MSVAANFRWGWGGGGGKREEGRSGWRVSGLRLNTSQSMGFVPPCSSLHNHAPSPPPPHHYPSPLCVRSIHNKPVNPLWNFAAVSAVPVEARALLPSTSYVKITLGAGEFVGRWWWWCGTGEGGGTGLQWEVCVCVSV